MTLRVALLNCAHLPEPDPDEAPLLGALRALGAEAQTLAWDAPLEPVEGFDLVVTRATWNYHLHPGPFLAFLERTARSCVLLNPLAVAQATFHKRYLVDLASSGVPVVPTTLWLRGSAGGLPGALGDSVVIKPAIAGASWEARRFAREDPAALAFLQRSLSERDTLVQPALPGFVDPGERSLVWIDGAFTHGVRKKPRFEGEDESVESLARLDPKDLAVARQAMATLPAGAVFARIDLVDHEGGPAVSEVETLEPSLFLWTQPSSARRLAGAILRRAR